MGNDPAKGNDPVAPPRLAATVLLLRDGEDGMEVFMVVRHHEIDFAAGALVFPGGRVDPGDHDIAADPALYPNADGHDGTALRVAAIRETFEECGVLLARPRGSGALVDALRLRAIEEAHGAALLAGTTSFAAMLNAEDLVLAPDQLVAFAHWITPVRISKRFDTHFFLAVAPDNQIAIHDGSESVDSTWISPRAAIAETEAGRYKLVFPTEMNLKKLGRHATTDEAIAAARASKVVTVLPEPVKAEENGIRYLRLPLEAGYGGEVFEVKNPPSIR
jgi:8-oxo-dGTP pyrophosphatase MutT (NUDIX family)